MKVPLWRWFKVELHGPRIKQLTWVRINRTSCSPRPNFGRNKLYVSPSRATESAKCETSKGGRPCLEPTRFRDCNVGKSLALDPKNALRLWDFPRYGLCSEQPTLGTCKVNCLLVIDQFGSKSGVGPGESPEKNVIPEWIVA